MIYNLLKGICLFFCSIFFTQQIYCQNFNLHSPSNNLVIKIEFIENQAFYSVLLKNEVVVQPSKMGISFENSKLFDRIKFISVIDSVVDYSWENVWGENAWIKDRHNQYRIMVSSIENPSITMEIQFRIFDDGLGFRYYISKQKDVNHLTVKDELSQFTLGDNCKVFWIPGDYDTNEYPYHTTQLSDITVARMKETSRVDHASAMLNIPAVQTPLMLVSNKGTYINIHEAGVKNFPVMNLAFNRENFSFNSHLVPLFNGLKAYVQTPFYSPWRTIILSKKATDILSSNIIVNLNDPAKKMDYSWIKPMKVLGVWWELHVRRSSWNYSDEKNIKIGVTDYAQLTPNGRHGANTQNVKSYMDFAKAHNIDGVLVEGWNIGWEDWYGKWKEEVFDFITPYPDFDLKFLSDYSKSSGIKLIMHHETSASACNYERYIDQGLKLMKDYGYPAAKTGYVGKIIPRGEFHDGQWMINHYERVAQKFMDNKLMLDAHEPSRPTGLHRTYPNWLACEAARGNEFNAWGDGNKPEHEPILAFTRLIGGPMDYTPGIFETDMSYYDKNNTGRVKTTLVKQLALYVTMYSPFQMAADLVENYEKHLDAFKFIEEVPVDFEKSIYLDAEPGDFVIVVRKDKKSDKWFLGGMTDENAKSSSIKLNFLPQGKYKITLFEDGLNASWDKNPKDYTIKTKFVTNNDSIQLKMASGGGVALIIEPVKK